MRVVLTISSTLLYIPHIGHYVPHVELLHQPCIPNVELLDHQCIPNVKLFPILNFSIADVKLFHQQCIPNVELLHHHAVHSQC
jgi:hypothetical protein